MILVACSRVILPFSTHEHNIWYSQQRLLSSTAIPDISDSQVEGSELFSGKQVARFLYHRLTG